ncbi:glycoside hydrolase family 172 protein [Catenulispora pinisilvae]|uniref:glycoside hydrolase family 172 protein n=1 Tax=Catenulispora pinisilvae TaxID=2705253 RepID=UPI001E42B950|nr:glycoside hydrolase family 172 protein [Catenulispora pinisilvae]
MMRTPIPQHSQARISRTIKALTAIALAAAGVLAAQPAAPAHADTASTAFTAKGPVGWDTLRHLDAMDTLPVGVQTKQFSSFDRQQQNNDWQYPCLRTTSSGACVIADHSGPGEIDAMWFTSNEGDVTATGNITVTLDGQTVLDAPLQDVVDGKIGAPFVYPLVANADQSSGGVYIEVPMPFRQSMTVTTQNNPQYEHVTYRTFADADGVSTFNPGDPATDVIAKLKAAGTADPKPPMPDTSTQSQSLDLAPGDSTVISDTHGPGQLTALSLALPQAKMVTPTSVTDDGRAFGANGSSTFTVAIDPDNNGVRLTRRYDPVPPDQAASVSVDGQQVAQWGPSTPASLGGWAEESVELPASATAGKSSITVKNTFVSSSQDYNEYTYWVDSHVAAGLSRTDTVDVGNAASESAHHYGIVGQTWQGTSTYSDPLDATQLAALTQAQQILQGLRVRITFDGTRTVDSPIGEFFGSGLAVAPVNSLMSGINPQTSTFTSWWPMPYLDGATVELYNGSGLTVTGSGTVAAGQSAAVGAALATGTIGYFRTQSNSGPTTANQDWTYLKASGTSKFVGVTVSMQGPINRSYLEGNERVYVDGARTPQMIGTGTEDFFQSGWYFNHGPDTNPFNGDPAHLIAATGCAASTDCTGAYRLMLDDAVSSGSSLSFGIQHGPANEVAADYSSTAYWYGTAQPQNHQTDQIATTGGTSLTDTYEGTDGTQTPVTADVLTSTTPQTLQLTLNPANRGATIIRTSDQLNGYQQAHVTVDGQPLPDWLEPLANPYHRWLDDTYLLPASVTAGHTTITVVLTPVRPWTASSYTVLSSC